MKFRVLKTFVDSRMIGPENKAWAKDLVFTAKEDQQTASILRELQEKKYIEIASDKDIKEATVENKYKASTKESKKRTRKA